MITDSSTFDGGAMAPEEGGEAVSGQLCVKHTALSFQSDTVSLELPLDGLIIDFGHRRDPRVYFSHEQFPGWQVWADSEKVLGHRNFSQRPELRQQIKDLRERREGWKRLRTTLGFLIGFAGLSVLGVWLSGWALRQVVNSVTVSYEVQLGKDLLAQVDQRVDFVQDPALTETLEAWAERLANVPTKAPFRYQVHLVDSPVPNAMALPGGHILVNQGLVKFCETPEELAGVLAHEIAHVKLRHGFRHIISAAGHYYILKLFAGDRRGVTGLISAGSSFLLRQDYSRKLESEADDAAWRGLVAADIDPRGLARFLQRMDAEQQRLWQRLGASNLALPRALSSHPETRERVARLDRKWQSSRRQNGFTALDPIPR